MARHVIRVQDDFDAAVIATETALAAGRVVIFPTETVYGIGVAAGDAGALDRLRVLKGRDSAKPFQCLASDLAMAESLGAILSPGARRLAAAFWPGPMTLVAPARGGGTIGVRVPDSAFILAVLRRTGRGIVSSSANPAGLPPPTTAAAADVFGDGVDLLVAGEDSPVGLPSTVIDCTGGGWKILREGAIGADAVAEAWGARETSDMAEDKRIAVGSDHAAAEVKDRLIKHLQDKGYEVKDYTVLVNGRADYPVAAHKVAKAVARGEFPKGLLLCGTGLGVSFVANRVRGIRAALCLDTEYARLSREHNNANILVLPGRARIYEPHEKVLDVWLETPFSGDERHVKRINMIDNPAE